MLMKVFRIGQAGYIRVPFADFNCLKLPAGTEHENDFALLADIFPTGWYVSFISLAFLLEMLNSP